MVEIHTVHTVDTASMRTQEFSRECAFDLQCAVVDLEREREREREG